MLPSIHVHDDIYKRLLLKFQVIYGAVISLVYYGYFTYYLGKVRKKDGSFPFTTLRDLFPKKLEGEVSRRV